MSNFFSYCEICGEEIKKGKKHCPACEADIRNKDKKHLQMKYGKKHMKKHKWEEID